MITTTHSAYKTIKRVQNSLRAPANASKKHRATMLHAVHTDNDQGRVTPPPSIKIRSKGEGKVGPEMCRNGRKDSRVEGEGEEGHLYTQLTHFPVELYHLPPLPIHPNPFFHPTRPATTPSRLTSPPSAQPTLFTLPVTHPIVRIDPPSKTSPTSPLPSVKLTHKPLLLSVGVE